MTDDMTAAPTEVTQPDPLTPKGGRWRLGLLTLIAIAAVVVGVIAFGGGDDTSLPTLPTGLQPSSGTPNGGDQAPDFEVVTFEGVTFRLSDHLATDGRPVILNLWASWCPPCRAEMPSFDRVASDRQDVLVLGIAVDDDLAPAQGFAQEIAVTYPLAFDADEIVADLYPTPGLPATFAIARDGSIRRVVFGGLDEDQIRGLADELTR